jgi:lysine 2,3-aminomutase
MMAVNTLCQPTQLIEAGLVPPDRRAALEAVAARYAVAITPALAVLIDPADPDDPLARQFVPDPAELTVIAQERADPIGDETHTPVQGIVHRYPDRVLLKLAHVCAVYCRYCFRREQVGPHKCESLSGAALDAALGYIKAHEEVWEVILTGGDPLVLSPRRLEEVVRRIADIGHVKVLRVHTRVPIAAPDRITPELVAAVRRSELATYVVVHANHPRELTAPARNACGRFIDAGIPVLSQSVLLRGVNDDTETLSSLMRAFVEARIKPYYLHHADLAPGTSHLRTTIAEGQALMRALHGRLSGLCQPNYVLDIPGGFGKSPSGPCYLHGAGEGAYSSDEFQGQTHVYPPET